MIPHPPPTRSDDVPAAYIGPDGLVNWPKVYVALGIDSPDILKNVLLAMLKLDATVSYYVHQHLLQLVFRQQLGRSVWPIKEPPPSEEFRWFFAESRCDQCPGSQPFEPIPGLKTTLCTNETRVARYEECLKFRENLKLAREADVTLPDVRKKLEEMTNGYNKRFAGPLAQRVGVVGEGTQSDQ